MDFKVIYLPLAFLFIPSGSRGRNAADEVGEAGLSISYCHLSYRIGKTE
jgi:hypothetical protein